MMDRTLSSYGSHISSELVSHRIAQLTEDILLVRMHRSLIRAGGVTQQAVPVGN